MPRVTKQTATAEARPPSRNGSMLSRGVPVSDLENLWMKFVIYGQNRTGKSTLACQFPKPLALLSCDPTATGGALSLRKIAGVTFFKLNTFHEYNQIVEELKADTFFKTHVLDSVTSFQNLVLANITGEKVPEQLDFGIVTQDQYRDRASQTKEALVPLLGMRAHTVILAKEKDHQPQEQRNKLLRGVQVESFFASDVGGATAGWLHDAADYIGRLYVAREIKRIVNKVKLESGAVQEDVQEIETGRQVRRLLTMLQPNFAAGFRSDTPSAVPEYVEASTPEEMYAEVIKVINGVKTAKGKYV